MSVWKLLILDDHALFREGLRLLLERVDPTVQVDEVASLAQATEACATTLYRFVLLDLGLNETTGIDTLHAFRQALPEVPVVVLSGDSGVRLVRSAIESGAVGFVPKSHTSELMIAALRFMLAGGIYLPPSVLQSQPVGVDEPGVSSAFDRMSPRQRETAKYALQGLSNKAIARKLGVAEGTIKAHLSAVFLQIGARSRVEAVLIAARAGVRFD